MKVTQKEIKHPNFISGNDIYIVKCPVCDKTNYTPAARPNLCAHCKMTFELIYI